MVLLDNCRSPSPLSLAMNYEFIGNKKITRCPISDRKVAADRFRAINTAANIVEPCIMKVFLSLCNGIFKKDTDRVNQFI